MIYDKKPFEGWAFNKLLENYYVCLVTLLFKKSLIKKLRNNFDPEFDFIADFDFQSFRPVFNSEYQTSNFRFKDNNVSFRFEPNEPMTLMNNMFSGDLISLLSFYSFIIIGYDMDTFVENSGNDYYKSAKNILDRALSFSSSSNWNPQSNGGRINKYWLIDSLLSSNYSIFKKINYIF